MPAYDFRCIDCKRQFDVFLSYTEYDKKSVTCPYCQGKNVSRKIGRVRIARSEESRMENLADPGNLEGLENDPRAMGKLMRQMSSELGEDIGPEFNEVVDRLEKGENPEDIEKAIPDLGMADGLGGELDGMM